MGSDPKRRKELLLAAAAEFDRLRSPFDGTWLSDHHVTLDECGDLSEDVARAIRYFVQMTPEQRHAYVLAEGHRIIVEELEKLEAKRAAP